MLKGEISLATFNMPQPSYNLSVSQDEDMKYAGSDSQREHGRGGLTSSSQEDLTIDMLRQSKDKEIDKVREALK